MGRFLDDLKNCSTPTLVVVLVANPRTHRTGFLHEVAAAVEAASDILTSEGAFVERVLHSMIVGLLIDSARERNVVALAAKSASSNVIEVRTIMVPIATGRDWIWLDSLVGDLSMKKNFGSFELDEAFRTVDGEPLPSS
jgi:hypothetical protein